jgi:hypothetical protein
MMGGAELCLLIDLMHPSGHQSDATICAAQHSRYPRTDDACDVQSCANDISASPNVGNAMFSTVYSR